MRHVKINGIWYRLAEDAEGQHYAHNREPLRPPNAQLVQGDSTDFQLRPDSLLWRITDWSGGEGQLKWDTANANRSYMLQGVNPFSRPGSLQLGYLESLAADSSASTVWINHKIVAAMGKLYVLAADATITNVQWADWDTSAKDFGARTTNNDFGSFTFGGMHTIGDMNYMYHWNTQTNKLVRFNGSAVTILNDQIDDGADVIPTIVELGAYVYILFPSLGTLYEVSKSTINTTTPEVALYEFDPGLLTTWAQSMTTGDGKVYFYTRTPTKTILHEVAPSSAAGAGYGRILSEIHGILGEGLWFNAGTLFLVGTDEAAGGGTNLGRVGPDRQIFYIDPQGQYGTLGSVRGLVRSPSDHGIAPGVNTSLPQYDNGFPLVNSRLNRIGVAIPPTSEDQDFLDIFGGLFEIDTLSGGFAAVGRVPTSLTGEYPWGWTQLLYWDSRYFLGAPAGTGSPLISWNTGAFTTQVGVATSPAHDFNLASTKILDTIEVSCESLPASNIITIGYSLDGAAWVDTNVVTTTGATSGSLQVSTDSSTKTFNNLQIRVKLTGSGGNSPVVRSIDTFARVNRKINTWDLLLDISDDSAPQGYSGQQILDNLLAVGDNTVIDFVDRYGTHIHDSSGDQYDVVIDAMSAVLDQPGEGIVAIRIVETI